MWVILEGNINLINIEKEKGGKRRRRKEFKNREQSQCLPPPDTIPTSQPEDHLPLGCFRKRRRFQKKAFASHLLLSDPLCSCLCDSLVPVHCAQLCSDPPSCSPPGQSGIPFLMLWWWSPWKDIRSHFLLLLFPLISHHANKEIVHI